MGLPAPNLSASPPGRGEVARYIRHSSIYRPGWGAS